MEDIAGALGIMTIFGFIAFVLWLKSKRKAADQQMVFEAQKQILDRLGSGPELTQFLASEEGKEFFTRLREPRKPPVQMSYVSLITGTLIGGLGAAGVGFGIFYAAYSTQEELVIPAGILVGAGAGLVAAAGTIYYLSKKWGLLQKEISKATESRLS